ncbi:transcription-repair coupling factor domain protein, partial [Chlamydia psittaci 84-8471/1]
MDFDPVNLNLSILPEITNTSVPLLIENILPGARSFLAAKFFYERKESVVMITTRSRIDDLFEDLSSFLGFPPVEFPSSEIDLSPKLVNIDAVGKRDKVLYDLYQKKAPIFCVTTLKALLEKTRSPKDTAHQHLDIQVGDVLDPDIMIDLCKNLGYRHETLASDKGEFAYRGGIIDIFPLSSPEPFRIEFWGEKIISIRPFN